MVGFREAPEIFSAFCGSGRPVRDTLPWYGALSDIEGMDDSDLVVNRRGERSRGRGGWAKKGDRVGETLRPWGGARGLGHRGSEKSAAREAFGRVRL
jgi:hypothetical protein